MRFFLWTDGSCDLLQTWAVTGFAESFSFLFFLLYPVFLDTMAAFLLFVRAAWWCVALQFAKFG